MSLSVDTFFCVVSESDSESIHAGSVLLPLTFSHYSDLTDFPAAPQFSHTLHCKHTPCLKCTEFSDAQKHWQIPAAICREIHKHRITHKHSCTHNTGMD